jgi:hypothetical protein
MTFKQLLLAGVALLPAVLPPIGEALDQTALLQCRVQSRTCEAVAVPPFVHHPDVPEREQQALRNPAQLVEASSTTPVAYDVGVPGYDIAPTGLNAEPG